MNSEFTVAIHCLLILSNKEAQLTNSEQIAFSVSTHAARVRKVLSLLRKHGFVTTKEGVGGGYLLAKDIDNISLGDLYRIFARGSLHPGWCSGNEQSSCFISSNIHNVMDKIYSEGEARLEAYFDELHLSDVTKLLQQCDSKDVK
ncbi:putative HTH-type transcriptional regulator YwnA [compost metagenome]